MATGFQTDLIAYHTGRVKGIHGHKSNLCNVVTPSRLTHGIVTDVEGEVPSRLTDHVNSCKGDGIIYCFHDTDITITASKAL